MLIILLLLLQNTNCLRTYGNKSTNFNAYYPCPNLMWETDHGRYTNADYKKANGGYTESQCKSWCDLRPNCMSI